LFFAAGVAVFVVYVGIVLHSVLHAPDPEQLELFHLRKHS